MSRNWVFFALHTQNVIIKRVLIARKKPLKVHLIIILLEVLLTYGCTLKSHCNAFLCLSGVAKYCIGNIVAVNTQIVIYSAEASNLIGFCTSFFHPELNYTFLLVRRKREFRRGEKKSTKKNENNSTQIEKKSFFYLVCRL